jgi:hypothetical protein
MARTPGKCLDENENRQQQSRSEISFRFFKLRCWNEVVVERNSAIVDVPYIESPWYLLYFLLGSFAR